MNRFEPRRGPLKRLVKAVLPARFWGFLRHRRLQWTQRRFRRRIVRHVYGGHPLSLLMTDPMSQSWYDVDWPDPPVLALLRSRRLRDGALVFNVGAHHGVMALILAHDVSPSGRVIALEAMGFNAEVAERNRQLNDTSHLTILHAAVGERCGRLAFRESFNSSVDDSAASPGAVEVEAVTLDELSRRYGAPAVVFMDIEGYECRALRGAGQTLAGRPDFVIEVHVGAGLESFGGSVDELLGFFPVQDWELWMSPEWATPESGGCRPFDRADPLVSSPFYLVATARTGGPASTLPR